VRRLPRLVLGLVVVASCLAPPLAPARAGLFASRVRRDGQWLRDVRGRVVLLRGLNYSGLEFGNFVGMPHGPEEADFAQMASWGVDVNDPDTHDFFYRFAEDSEREVGDPTVVFVPAARHYPQGFAVETSPGDTATFDATRSRLIIRRDRRRPVHTVRIRPV
jgi:hypothetical protein